MRKNPDGTVGTLVQAQSRAKVLRYHFGPEYIEAEVELLEDVVSDPASMLAMKRELETRFNEVVKNKTLQQDTVQFIQTLENPAQLADHIAFNFDRRRFARHH